jgi:hypothetical protein
LISFKLAAAPGTAFCPENYGLQKRARQSRMKSGLQQRPGKRHPFPDR